MAANSPSDAKIGIAGLDDVLGGGLERSRIFLLEGSPGTGKTTIAMQFLLEGAAAGERCLYITLSETEDELRASAVSHGWDLGRNRPFSSWFRPRTCSTKSSSRACSIPRTSSWARPTKRIFEAFERVKPDRVVLDSLSEIRLLAQSSLRYRRQILAPQALFRAERAPPC